MIIRGTYDINLTINNTPFSEENSNMDVGQMSFSIRDSIFNLFNEASIEIYDPLNIIAEYGFNTQGLDVTVDLSYVNETVNGLKGRYKIDKDSTYDRDNPTNLGGKTELILYNRNFYQQPLVSKGYNSRISDIVRQLSGTKQFESPANINDTGNQDLWFQLLVSDFDFIVDMLLPNAYSQNSNNTPFFCFIDSKDTFNFVNYQSMYNTAPVATLIVVNTEGGNISPNLIQDIQRVKLGADECLPMRKRNIYQFDSTSNALITVPDDFTMYKAINETGSIQAIKDDASITGMLDLGFKESEVGRQENNNGLKISSMRDSLFLEKFKIVCMFNPLLISGKTIQITSPAPLDGNAPSQIMSGKYLIVSSDHVWNAERKEAYSQLIVTRKVLPFPATNSLVPQMYKV